MKLLLDECIPHRLRLHLSGHDAYSVAYMGWGGIKNGRLLALAAADGFEALVTTD
jgi:predicted nuclease of predicted toxin-antitoxin system